MKRRAIFGYSVAIRREDGTDPGRLEEEFDLYPAAAGTEATPLDIVFTRDLGLTQDRYENPAKHADLEDGFVAHFNPGSMRFQTRPDGSLARVLVVAKQMSRAQEARQRRQNIQYATHREAFGQILHELVLVPAVYFQKDLAPVHASAVQAGDGSVTMIGGTGGVGKTSLELELCRHRGFSFLADDIGIIDAGGNVAPNMNHPKIYGYNVVDDPVLERTLLKGASLGNRLQWRIKHQRSPATVRRRISPLDLYGGHAASGGPLRRYVILVRDRSPGIDSRLLKAEEAAAMSLSVMQTEYNIFDNHVHWHEFNRSARGTPPLLTMDAVWARWRRVYSAAFQNVECLLIRGAREIDHKSFVTEVADLVAAPPEHP